MITITLRLSESLLCILKDINTPKQETYSIQVEKDTTIKQVLLQEGINPLLAPMVAIDSVRVDIHTHLKTDTTITIYGPLAGG